MLPKIRKLRQAKDSGQMLLSVLIGVGVFAILAHALFTLVASSFDLVNFNKSRIAARHLATEKLEFIRNIPYEDVGTIGGIPNGIIAEEENIVQNGLNYKIKTTVVYIDDEYDFRAPSDLTPNDYKRARIEVSWEGLADSRKNPIVLITDITTPETTESGDEGTLIIKVFNANGQPLAQAQVTIVASSITPPVNLTTATDNDGEVRLPGATPCDSCYQITVTKSGYSTDRTYGTSEVTNPIKSHASLLVGEVTQLSFQIDLTGTINISSTDSRENGFVPKAGVAFNLRGNKIIGTNSLGQYVYKYDESHSTDSNGNFSLSNAEWDTYKVIMPSSTSWDISGSYPLQPISLLPGGTIDLAFAVVPHTAHSFLAILEEPSQTLIASATARLYKTGYEQILESGQSGDPDFGQAFFSGLDEDSYQIEATASGYLNFSGNFDVSGATTGIVVLTPE